MSWHKKPIHWLIDPPPAGLGFEFRPHQVVLARFSEKRGRREMDLCLKSPVPSGVIEYSMLEPNLKEPDGMAAFLRQLLDQAGVRGRRVALTVPDTLARISVEDLPEAAGSKRDVAELLRFRLKKTLPFETERARIAFHALPGRTQSFFTGVMQEEVVTQYEALLEGLGFHVGVVETSSLSLLNLWCPVVEGELPPGSDYFFLNVEEEYFSVVLVRERLPVLLRTLGHRSGHSSEAVASHYAADELVRELIPTLIYYREKLGGDSPARVYYRSLRPDLSDLPELLELQFEVPVEPVDLKRAVAIESDLNIDADLASTVSAAAGAALGRAA
jgi:type IV pilus assembly protein PilM